MSSPDDHLMTITHRPSPVMVRGRGSWLWDDSGRRYLDFVQGWAVNCLGHAPGEIRRALTRQSEALLTPSPAFHNGPQLALSSALAHSSGLDRVFFANSGAEANEGAIKLARKWGGAERGGAYEIVTTENAFHGRTLATMAASGKPGWDDLFPPVIPGFVKVPFGDVAAMEAVIGAKTAALMVEPIQGEGGVVTPPRGYLRALRELADRHGLLLILDEIQTGMGRTGRLFAHQHERVRPDIMTLGKGLGGGVPLAALLARESVCRFEPGDQGGTMNGNPLMTAVGLAVHRKLAAPGFLAKVRDRSSQLRRGLTRLAKQHGLRGVRGAGLLLALELGAERAPELVETCRERGLLLNAPRPDLLRFMPALNVRASEVDTMLARLDRVLASGWRR
jgi:acetylornithine/N-succinyldiaminopimelate aminotransferase